MKEFSRVDKKAKTKWRVSRFVGLLFLAIASAVLLLAVGSSGESTATLVCAIICGVVLLLQLVNLIVYPMIEYIQWQYLVDDDRIEIKKGIFWRSHTVVPISRIQHVSVKSGPMQNIFGLSSVEINTAGGVHTIDELNKEVAAQICDKLRTIINLKVAEQRARELIAAGKVTVPAAVSTDAEVGTDA
ncbi:MAG: hypothetical protein E7554_08630 [Ruminococcaceae bacterium]|nr:hypothetical protein [Oscillospiraceae bacterium]